MHTRRAGSAASSPCGGVAQPRSEGEARVRQDFSEVQEDMRMVPRGTYHCRVAEVRPGLTRNQDPMWAYRLEVVSGAEAGRTAAWDRLVWSERGMPRVKLVLEALGWDVSGVVELESEELEGREALVEIVEEEGQDAMGRRRLANSVSWGGYQGIDTQPATPCGEHEQDGPF